MLADVKTLVDCMLTAAAVPAETMKAAQRYESFGITNRDFIRLDRNFDGRSPVTSSSPILRSSQTFRVSIRTRTAR